MNEQKVQSPHPNLQRLLPRLAEISGDSSWRPAFRQRGEAEQLIAIVASSNGRELELTPVWSLDHDDLIKSRIVGWTVSEEVN